MMLTENGFDEWSKDYDSFVMSSENNNAYPFAGYNEIMRNIYNVVCSQKDATVLDIGFGTAFLTTKLYTKGYSITGLDFSQNMISIAQEKMPNAILLKCDFNKGLPEQLKQKSFDFIISTYAMHHVDAKKRADFLADLAEHLNKNGVILIGDVAFATAKEYATCKEKNIDIWDNEEIYFTYDELAQALQKIGLKSKFQPLSICAGIITITK